MTTSFYPYVPRFAPPLAPAPRFDTPRSHISCPQCRTYRVVTLRQARRVRTGENTGVCASCRGNALEVRSSTDNDLAFWLHSFGVRLPRGLSAREAIRAGFAPPDLVELARQVWPH